MDLTALATELGLSDLPAGELKALIVLGIVAIWADRLTLVAGHIVRLSLRGANHLLRTSGLVHAPKVTVRTAVRRAVRTPLVHHSIEALAAEATLVAAGHEPLHDLLGAASDVASVWFPVADTTFEVGDALLGLS